MPLTKTNIGTKPDGSPNWIFVQCDADGVPVTDPRCDRTSLRPVVITGPITGDVQTADGTTYDITESVIEVDTEAHAAEVADLIGQRFETEGHPDHVGGDVFTYTAPEA